MAISPVAEKLGIKSGMIHALLLRAPSRYKKLLEPLPEGGLRRNRRRTEIRRVLRDPQGANSEIGTDSAEERSAPRFGLVLLESQAAGCNLLSVNRNSCKATPPTRRAFQLVSMPPRSDLSDRGQSEVDSGRLGRPSHISSKVSVEPKT
jgi:hypothetical protein